MNDEAIAGAYRGEAAVLVERGVADHERWYPAEWVLDFILEHEREPLNLSERVRNRARRKLDSRKKAANFPRGRLALHFLCFSNICPGLFRGFAERICANGNNSIGMI